MQLNGVRVSRETQVRFEQFIALFQKWAKVINLVAPSTKSEVWQRHVADSAQIFQLSPDPKRWIDLGSGGGFPGIVTAILLAETGEGWVHMVESNKKKAAFLRAAIQETGARGSVHAVRIEAAVIEVPECDAISARALADLDQLCEYSSAWMSRSADCRAFFHKGRDCQAEIDNARGRWQFDLVKHSSVIAPDSAILEIRDLRRKKQQ